MKLPTKTEQAIIAEIRQALQTICERCPSLKEPSLNIWLFARTDFNRNFSYEWQITRHHPDEKVAGVSLAECVDEFCRRVGWQDAQRTLLAGPATIEAEADVVTPEPAAPIKPSSDDDIPF